MKGPGTNAEQIESLKAKMEGPDIETATNLAGSQSPRVLTLAYKLMRAEQAKQKGLPKGITNLLQNMSREDAAAVTAKLQAAKSKLS